MFAWSGCAPADLPLPASELDDLNASPRRSTHMMTAKYSAVCSVTCQDGREFPRRVPAVEHGRVAAMSSGGRHQVRRVAYEQGPPGAEAVGDSGDPPVAAGPRDVELADF